MSLLEMKRFFYLFHSNHYMQNYDVKTSLETRARYYQYISSPLKYEPWGFRFFDIQGIIKVA